MPINMPINPGINEDIACSLNGCNSLLSFINHEAAHAGTKQQRKIHTQKKMVGKGRMLFF